MGKRVMKKDYTTRSLDEFFQKAQPVPATAPKCPECGEPMKHNSNTVNDLWTCQKCGKSQDTAK